MLSRVKTAVHSGRQNFCGHSIGKKPTMSLVNADEAVEMERVPSSPGIKRRRIQQELNLQAKKYDDHWDSCCMRIDRRATRYFSQLAIALVVMVFCIIMLVRHDDCPSQQLYSGLLTTVIGIMLPSPSLH